MNPIIKTSSALAIAAIVAGCASQPDQIAAASVSPTAYQGLTCNALRAENNRLVQSVNTASAAQSQAASSDAGMTAVSLILFWPAAFAIKGDKATAAELARVKGEYQAVQSQMTQRGC